MLTTTCHCGDVRIEVPEAPDAVTNCNCSICRRLGALWAFYEPSRIRLTGHPERTEAYVWGKKTLRTVRCRNCGCVTHWEPLEPKPNEKLGVNIRNFDPKQLGSFRIRLFDGADTWKYID